MGPSSYGSEAATRQCSSCGDGCDGHGTHFRNATYCPHCWQELQRTGIADWLPQGSNGHLAPAREPAIIAQVGL